MSRKGSKIDNALADTGDVESHDARKRKHAEDSGGSDSSDSDEEDRRVQKKLLLDLKEWEKGWNVELNNQRKKVYKRALKAYITGFRPSSRESTPSNIQIKKEPESITGSSIVVVEGKFERMNSFTFIPTARSVKEPNDPVRRSALLSSGEEDDEWVEDLADWSMENDKERQKILAFSEHILSSCAPRDILQELFTDLSNGKRKSTFVSTKLEVNRILRSLARQKIGGMSAVELLKR
ncbi:hypothetical protein SpCBS45565_g00264 [Spizellomyces sp. 'palustris']|nr:hypothetical protein SpCBS45565_g00264 [Spizellomyces sp. 'palustris']